MPPKGRKVKVAAEAKIKQQLHDIGEGDKPGTVGFKLWRSNTQLASGEKLSQHEAQWNVTANKFTQSVEVQHNEAFTLKPFTVTEGLHKGKHVLMLMPVANEDYFRFLDLPPELRKMVYDLVFEDSKMLDISTVKPVGRPRRAVRNSFHVRSGHQDLSCDRNAGKWLSQPPSSASLLRVSKQLRDETAPILYAHHTFAFTKMADAAIFLETAGEMRAYIRNVHFSDYAFQSSKLRPILNFLADAKGLRSISMAHRTICAGWTSRRSTTAETAAELCRPFLKAMHKARKDDDEAVDAMDVLQIRAVEKCLPCKNGKSATCWGVSCSGRSVMCNNLEEHNTQTLAKFRAPLLKVLGIEEVVPEAEENEVSAEADEASSSIGVLPSTPATVLLSSSLLSDM